MKHKGNGVGEKRNKDGGNSRKMQGVDREHKFNKREYLKHKFQNNFGTRQEGHGLALLQKKKVMLRYDRDKKREEQRSRKQNEHRLLFKGGSQLAECDREAEKDFPLFNQEKTTKDEDDSEVKTCSIKPRKLSKFKKAEAEYQKKQDEKQMKHIESNERQISIETAKNKYKEKRLERYKKLNQRTKKGQPVMKGRIELMLQKLQEDINKNS
ncbi:unnamed protein product [Meganyctiphanes norvegica]|uniref:Thyroid transcription factor 1-associated protein 26 n=1 Tax=Meganyctiphanes norvegica TaxID=48144 RepID=A0AAV2QHU1_MEGNR